MLKNESLARELRFTETYQRYRQEHPAIREAMCLQTQYPDFFTQILDGDLFAGRIDHPRVGFSPDEWGKSLPKNQVFPQLIYELIGIIL